MTPHCNFSNLFWISDIKKFEIVNQVRKWGLLITDQLVGQPVRQLRPESLFSCQAGVKPQYASNKVLIGSSRSTSWLWNQQALSLKSKLKLSHKSGPTSSKSRTRSKSTTVPSQVQTKCSSYQTATKTTFSMLEFITMSTPKIKPKAETNKSSVKSNTKVLVRVAWYTEI